MSFRKTCIVALSMSALLGLASASTQAQAADRAARDAGAMRSFLHDPGFHAICPLAVYVDDYARMAKRDRPTHARRLSGSLSSAKGSEPGATGPRRTRKPMGSMSTRGYSDAGSSTDPSDIPGAIPAANVGRECRRRTRARERNRINGVDHDDSYAPADEMARPRVRVRYPNADRRAIFAALLAALPRPPCPRIRLRLITGSSARRRPDPDRAGPIGPENRRQIRARRLSRDLARQPAPGERVERQRPGTQRGER